MFFGIDLVEAIQIISYPGIFAIILAESGLFFAIYLPGGSLLFTAGLLASQGILNIWILFATVITAAVLGDTIGYWFGAWVGPALYRRKNSRFLKQEHLEQTRLFFEEHGAKTILLARFVPIVRTFAPILAGVGNMHYSTFLFYNVLGALLWGGGFTLAGYFLGEAIPDIEHSLEYIVLAIVVVTMLPLAHHVWKMRKVGATKTPSLPTAAPKAVIFDLDDTLAESFQKPEARVMEKLYRLADSMPVAIMTGATFGRVERDVMNHMPEHLRIPFYVFSDNGSRADEWIDGHWVKRYGVPLGDDEREFLRATITEAVEELDLFEGKKDFRIVDRGTSVSFVALAHEASKAEKEAWDPEFVKRPKLAQLLRDKAPAYDVLIAGRTTIDIVRKGISKAYGVEWFANELKLPASEMLFIGDAFYEGGNDATVIPTGIQTYATSGPEETEGLIDDLLTR